jgi:hypothetical protein
LNNFNLKDLCLGNNGFAGTPPADIVRYCDWLFVWLHIEAEHLVDQHNLLLSLF